jgi:hypothetical protein
MADGLSGPHVAAAFLCERVLQERDMVPSFIRVVDRFLVPVMPKLPPGMQLQMQPPTLQVTLVISLKAGTLGGGSYNIRVKIHKPDGSEMSETVVPVFFNGSDDNGVLAGSPLAVVSPEQGLYWIDVYFEESLLTRIPMRVLHQQVALPIQPEKGQ